MDPNLDLLVHELPKHFRPTAAHGLELRLRLAIPGEHLDLTIEDSSLAIPAFGEEDPDVTFIFDTSATARQIMLGQENAIEAFMHGRFKADGYLMLAFRLMEIFESASLPPTPND